jgi:hypothetical protein
MTVAKVEVLLPIRKSSLPMIIGLIVAVEASACCWRGW